MRENAAVGQTANPSTSPAGGRMVPIERSTSDDPAYASAVVRAIAAATELLLSKPLHDCALDALRIIGSTARARTATLWRYVAGETETMQHPVYRWTTPGHTDHAIPVAASLPLETVIGEVLGAYRQGDVLTLRVPEWGLSRGFEVDHWAVRTIYTAPVFVNGSLWGDLSLGFSDDTVISTETSDVIRSACSCFAGAIELDRTRQQLARRDTILTAVTDVAQVLTNAASVEAGATAALEALGSAAGAFAVVLCEHIEEASGEVRLKTRGRWSTKPIPDPPYLDGKVFAMADELATLQRNEVARGHAIEQTPETIAMAERLGIRDGAIVPVWVGDRLWGGLRFAFEEPQELSPGEVDAIRTGANIFGSAINAEIQATALAATEDRLRQGQKLEAIGRLAGGVAHDFNNLLTVILGYAGGLYTRTGSEDAAHIVQAAERASALTNQLLTFSRQAALRNEVVDLVGVVEQSRVLLTRLIGETIAINCEISPGCGNVVGDATQFHQVIMNLALNARDAMPDGGTLTLRVAPLIVLDDAGGDLPPGSYVHVAVEDTGIGMDVDTVERAAEPFFSTKPFGKGTGLGLSTVYGIVRRSDGQIRVSSVVGEGTTVDVYLPSTDAPAAPSAELVTAPDTADSGAIVLLVEDEEIVRTFTTRALRRSGYDVLVASRPDEALGIARATSHIDALVSDVVMPGMNGYDLALIFQELHPSAAVILTSGYPGADVIPETSTNIEFLAKPFGSSALLDSLSRALAKRRA